MAAILSMYRLMDVALARRGAADNEVRDERPTGNRFRRCSLARFILTRCTWLSVGARKPTSRWNPGVPNRSISREGRSGYQVMGTSFAFVEKISRKARYDVGALPRLFASGRPLHVAPRSSRTARSRRILARIAGCLRLSRPEGPPTRPGSRDGSPRSPGGPPLKRHPARASDRARDRRPRPRHDCKPAFVRGARSGAERIALLALHPSRPARIGGRLEACLPRAPNPDAPPRTGPAKKKARRVRPKNRR